MDIGFRLFCLLVFSLNSSFSRHLGRYRGTYMDTVKPRELLDALSLFGGVPVMDIKLFSERTGMSVDAVNKAIQRGQIPVVRISERRRFVNIVLLVHLCLTGELPNNALDSSKVLRGNSADNSLRSKKKRH